jgi:O-antigen/teichoic acid export membrane protein
VFPALSSAVAEPEAFKAIARRALHTIALLTVPMAVGVMLLADRVLLALGYPVSFANSAILLVLLAPTIALAAIDTLIGTALNAQGRQKQWALTAIAAAVLNPAANLVAIPYAHATFGNGAIAAAAITTLTEIFMMVVGAWLLGPSGVLSATSLTQAVKCVLASAIMAAVVWPLREAPIVVPVVTGALVYGGACLALGTVTLGELREIRTHLLRPRGALGAAEGQAA